MNAAAIINAIDMVSVALGIAAIGLQSTLGLGLAFVRADPAGATRSMLAMFIAVPAFVLAVIWMFPLERSVALALLAGDQNAKPNKHGTLGGPLVDTEARPLSTQLWTIRKPPPNGGLLSTTAELLPSVTIWRPWR